MMADDQVERSQSAATHLRFLGGVALTVALALAAFFLLLEPPTQDFLLMALFLSITALVSVAAGYGAYRLGWIHHSPRIRWVLLGGYVLASVLTFLNVWITARLMFASRHDLLLATVLLLFAGGIATSVGYFLSAALTDRIVTLDRAAGEITRERLDVRVPVQGKDEMANLARTFNRMVAELEAAARKQDELDTLRRNLIASVGHDLRTPLASIRAIVEALADGVVDDPEVEARYLGTARREIQALSLLIDDLFELAQIEAGGLSLELGANSLSDLISDTIESFSELAARQGVELAGSVEPGVDPVRLDARQIGRVLSNLVGNAVRHTPPGGCVEIRATALDGAVRVDVSDTGEGIEPADLPHIFERFYRGEKSRSRATGGAGLGLAIARGLVEAHGGAIGVQSTPGGGTVFHFALPKRKF
ncbi:MAG TPA: HAMP domain-containing sensor histidine kinase [Anaerolineae bacterium]|nr:HAMP domain-containing sensor histidine kinase [Anaerolineae bacterium]